MGDGGWGMSIDYLRVSIVKRSQGQSAVAVAAQRSGERLYDRQLGLHVRPEHGGRPTVAEILLPDGAPSWLGTREELWNAAEAAENYSDAQLAREVELAWPSELADTDALALVREFVQQEFVGRGMIADLTINLGRHNPRAYAMLALREVTPTGFGRKVREWHQAGWVGELRKHWAAIANEHLSRVGYPVPIDHRSKDDQTAAVHPAKAASAMQWRGPRAKGEA